MTKRLDFPVDADGNIVTQKVLVGCDKSHNLTGRAKALPAREVNFTPHSAPWERTLL